MKALAHSHATAYDDPSYNYLDYWSSRDYEHLAEVMAIRRLLKGRRYQHAVDIGGGFGRLSMLLTEYADRVTLTDSSSQQLVLAARFLAGHPEINRRLMEAGRLDFPDQSVDLVTLVRVLHHLPDPSVELRELSRVLRPGGSAVIEVANSAHALNRLRYLTRGQRIPLAVLDIRATQAWQADGVPFVNHHPRTITTAFATAGLRVQQRLSVSNFRHARLKATVPPKVLLAAERLAQPSLAAANFGPSSFYLLQK
jgi:ubiquinone/menaquinone biosynthesis C-methylase UbiE